ncbi:C3 and PZP-like alpha-2-macroglobulin domain-containing protein 8 [Holothuria leucospilota]|uniref:C3 and PZP-like alpha-2-macroglobulin domain-containing protein 8 n=1 Tax=Holothuria leucospilota TaxID=206669 RepID=A0A9Q1CQD0_HOLLE|nr:C3 and PZP-like alpha-2-macroglobulin domain-containing protein 8 [Holothuria leucospilota]
MKMFIVPVLFLTILPDVSFGVNSDDATCIQPLEVNTTTGFYFRYLPVHPGTTRITFDAKANNDVHIGLFPDQGGSEYYLIVIGSYANRVSDIRRCSSCVDVAEHWETGIVTQDEFRRFWITFDCNGNISVGRNEEATPLLQWTDPNPLTVNYMGYSTGWGSTGEFRFCDFGGESMLVCKKTLYYFSLAHRIW